MGIAYNPKIVNNGLMLYLDAANANKSAKGFKNLLDLSTWTLGTGGVTGFTENATAGQNENRRILDTGPFGVSALVWDTPSNDATSDADGGWNSSYYNIDPTKRYRFSVWIRRKILGNGPYYLGTYGLNSSNTNEGVLNRSDGAINTNAYFAATTWPVSILANEWMLVVGHVWPAGSGTGSAHVDSGLWNTSGTKFSNTADFVWQATNAKTAHRSYLYYSTDTTTNQQWYQPRIDLCDGTEPTIAELIAGVGSKWYDLTGTNHGNILNSAALYNSAGYMTFDGVDDSVNISDSSSLSSTSALTINCWVRATAFGGGYSSIVGKGTSDSDEEYCVLIHSSFLYFDVGTGGPYTQPSFTFNTNTWYNICCVHSRTLGTSSLSVYVNGILLSNTVVGPTTTPNDNSLPVSIGSRFYNSSNGLFNGNIAQVSIYNRALSASEIKQNFNATRGRFGVT